MTIEWVHNRLGSGSKATLSTILILAVAQNLGTRGGPPPKWKASVFGATLKGEFTTEEEAKSAAERVAQKHLSIASSTF